MPLTEQSAWLHEMLAKALEDPPLEESLSESDLWSRQGPLIRRASRFEGLPNFYPVYQYGDCYSYSLLALIVKKGGLDVNPSVADLASSAEFLYAPTNETIDREIIRIGGPVAGTNSLQDPADYALRLAEALKTDIGAAESDNPDCTNVILCGGRDSLNLLLLPWKNHTVVVSAKPNHDLVAQFIQANDLDLELQELEDPVDEQVMDHEILENACRTNLEHARWGAHLCRIAQERERKVIFWKGQVADAFTTPKWMILTDPPSGWSALWRKAYRRLIHWTPKFTRLGISRGLLEKPFRRTIWDRCGMWQGSHVAMVRGLTGCLTLSAYHGSEVNKVFADVDLLRAVPFDVRPEVGRHLLGRPPIYPTQNPSPKPSAFRAGACQPSRFYALLESNGIRVTNRATD